MTQSSDFMADMQWRVEIGNAIHDRRSAWQKLVLCVVTFCYKESILRHVDVRLKIGGHLQDWTEPIVGARVLLLCRPG